MAPYFAQPIKPTQSLRARRHAAPRKRKRPDDDDNEDDNQDSDKGRDRSPESSTRATPAISTLSAADARQFRTAGHDPDDDLPPDPFPHAPTKVTVPKLRSSEIQQKLADLKPPIYAPGLSKTASVTQDLDQRTSSFKRHHLSVLTTVMHHCLLKGDYQRAGRAWGMLLRAEHAGTIMDIRNHGRWGIGAEVLLHGRSKPTDSVVLQDGDDSDGPADQPGRNLFSEEGFQAAREYYERVIVQYPFLQTHPHKPNALTFYPAMFSLWIYQISQETSRAMEEMEKDDLEESDAGSEFDSRSEDNTSRQTKKRDAKIVAIRVEELKKAQEIAERLDKLLTSPPFDKNVDLLQLRGMIAVWISDLLKISISDGQAENGPNPNDAAAKDQKAIARDMFNRVKSNGGNLKDAAEQFLANANG
ncbi:hypothetical protein HDK90DRAFT_156597 [Phyllosticta capitalensis]|uniref:Uncharacterized protein n=1 Tax=Phyllosticta capitalensis TaxID=121624 RepID=A0ABR1Z0E5_9PEZI